MLRVAPLRRISMLTLIPKSWLSWDFRIEDDGREIAFIDRDWFRERATFAVDGAAYDVRRTSVVQGTFTLERGGVEIARAQKTSAFRRAFEIETADHERYELRAASTFRREFQLTRGGVPVGSISPVSMFGRTATAHLPETVPRPVQLFMLFLVLVLWKRRSDASKS
jgi:hypothetical protein